MKENINEEIQENLINNEVEQSPEQKKKHSKKTKLHTINSLIDTSERDNLVTLAEQLNEDDSDYDPDADDMDDIDLEKKGVESSAPKIIFNIKNYVFAFCLLFSSFLNYNFLYFPYIILGIFLSFIIFNNRNKTIYRLKKISELIVLIYSVLLLIFKIVFIVLTKNGNDWLKDKKELFINLGVKLLKDEDSTLYLVASFLSESIIIIISLVSYIISVCFIDFNLEDEINYEKKTKNEIFGLLIKHLIINYFTYLFSSIFNTSLITMIYLSLIIIILFFTVKNTNLEKVLIFFKIDIILNLLFLILQIFFINLLNCYQFEDIITSNTIETGEEIKYFSIYSQIGIRIMLKNDTLVKRVVHCLSYFFLILALFSTTASNNEIGLNLLIINFHKEHKKNDEKKNEENLFNKIKLKLKTFFTSPGFLLHICRILGIIYLYYLRNFFAIIVFIWLFFSFLNFHIRANKHVTFVLLFFIFVSFILFHCANINGYFEEEKQVYYHLNIYKVNERFKYYLLYLCINLFIFFDLLFIFSLYNADSSEKIIKKEEKKEVIEEPEKKEAMEENLIVKENEQQAEQANNEIIEIEEVDENNKQQNENNKDNKDEKDDELKKRRVTEMITSNEIKELKISKKLKIDKETLNNLTILNIIAKAFLSHIDKVSLIAMYFICINSMNVIHLILVIIFMLQLLFPELIVLISKYLMMIMQILYLIEFVVDIFKTYYLDDFNSNEELLQVFINYNTDPSETSVEIYFYIIVYLFYIQYKLYNHSYYKNIVSEKKISLTNFIHVKFHSLPKLKNTLFFIGKIIIEIYIWILIALFIVFDTYFEISLLFEIKLILFFIIVFQFLISMQNTKKNYISLILNWIFLSYCTLNSFLAYGYQIICLDYFKDGSQEKTKSFIENNLPSLGFSHYKDKLYYRFMPHFICNFISVLFLWEMKRILLRNNEEQGFGDLDKEIIIEDEKNKNEEEKEKGEELGATEEYEKNKKRMNKLEAFYYLYSIILIFTKFYWLFLFIYLGIIFTTLDLSIVLILYILIFGIIYIKMFYRIITKLNAYINQESFFISRLIRYNLVELDRHEQQNKYYRMMGFEYLLLLSLIIFCFYYTFGIFHQVQNGCNFENNNGKYGWDGCDNRHEKIINDEDNIISALAYLIGFWTECDYVLEESWFHLLFGLLVSFDLYVIKLENFINKKIKENREEYKSLANKNVKLKVLTFDEKNMLFNISHILNKAQDDINNVNLIRANEIIRKMEEHEKKKKNELQKLRGSQRTDLEQNKIKYKIDTKNKEEDKRIGEKLIKDFLNIFRNSTEYKNVKLSTTNNKYEIIKVVKNIFEEMIIFLLICTSISKMDIWSFVYLLISLILIITKKKMIKFYLLYCFMIFSTLIQAILFVSNIQISTEPNADYDLLNVLRLKFNIPWYKHGKFSIDDKLGYFFGVGASKLQINLLWMEFIEIILIYIYLDYFSYCIYQDEQNIGKLTDKKKQMNYHNLQVNEETKKISLKLTEEEYQRHIQCMKYNFNVDVSFRFKDLSDFKKFMDSGVLPLTDNEKKERDKILRAEQIKEKEQLPMIKEEQEEMVEEEKKDELKDKEPKKEEQKIEEQKTVEKKDEIEEEKKELDLKNIIENKMKIKNELTISTKEKEDIGMKEKTQAQPGLLFTMRKQLSKKKTEKKSLFEESKVQSESGKNKCYAKLKDFLFLSFHNVILIFIIIISMMISGLFSVVYILLSFYFLITSTSIFLGNKYLYPRAIKTLLRIIILVDILLQILYQTPFFDSIGNTIEIIGLNKILNFTLVEEKNDDKYYEAELVTDQLLLVLAKAITYLVMSFQVLVYSSHNFQEYYFSYIITKGKKLRRISLMNVFKFNNNRISDMNNSLNLRNDVIEAMDNIEKTFNKWNIDLKKKKSAKKKKQKKSIFSNIFKKNEKEKEEDKKDITKEKQPQMKLKGKTRLPLKISKIALEGDKPVEKKKVQEEKPKEEKIVIEEEKKEIKKPGVIFGIDINLDKSSEESSFEEEEEEEDKILPKEEVYKKIKDMLLGGFLMKIYLYINERSSSYMSIKKNEKTVYENMTIKGNSKIVPYIENMVDMQLLRLDLTNFTSRELKEVFHYLDGSRQKKLDEKKKEEEKKKESEKQIKEDKNKDLIIEEEINIDDKPEKKTKEKVINLNDSKFIQFESFMLNKLFVKYLTKSYIIKCILRDIFTLILNNFYWICYLVMIIDHMMTATFLSLLYPISIFCFAIFEYPRPPKIYWRIALFYSVFLLLIKFIFHIQAFRDNKSFNDFITKLYNYKIGVKIYESSFSGEFLAYILYDALVLIILLINDYLLVSRGIWLKREQEIENIYQANERISKSNLLKKGNKDDDDGEAIKEIKKFNNEYLDPDDSGSTQENKKDFRFSSLLITDDKSFKEEEKKTELKKDDYDKLIKGYNLKLSTLKTSKESLRSTNSIIQERITKTILDLKNKKKIEDEAQKEKEKYEESSRSYFQRLFPKIRNEKPGNEFYAWYTTSLTFIIIFILIFYTTMINDKTFGAIELDTKQFSGEMVLVLIIHVAILVYDRVLYINQNRKNLQFEYIFYDKVDGKPLPENIVLKESERNGQLIPPKRIESLKEKYNVICVQEEEFNSILLQKYILHMIVTIGIHLFIFYYCPMIGNNNIYGEVFCQERKIEEEQTETDQDDNDNNDEVKCNDFSYNKALIFFYLIYLIYFVSSGLQIKYGFYDMKRKSLLKSGDKSINGVIYNIFKAIPFLYEIKLAIDWTFTKTCLDLFQWNKFEGVYDTVYVTFCAMNAKNQQLVGQKIGKLNKIGMGGGLAFILILILIAPMILFSSLNPTNKINNLTGAELQIDLCFFYKNKAVQNYTLYTNTRPESIDNITESEMELYNYTNSTKTKNFDREQIQTVSFFPESDKNWDLTSPLIEKLKDLIKERKNTSDLEYIALAIEYNFDRPLPVASSKVNKRYTRTIYYYNNYTNDPEYEYIQNLGDALESCYDMNITYKNIYSPPIRLSSNIKPKSLKDPKYFPDLDAELGFVGCKNVTKENGGSEPSYLESYFTLKKVMNKNGIKNEEGFKFHVFSDKVSSTVSGSDILTIYISVVLVAGNYIRNFFAGQPEKIMLTEMPYTQRIIDICEGIKISRNSYDFQKEEKYYYLLIELMRSPEYLQNITSLSMEQFRRRKEKTRVNKTTDGI